MRRSPANTRSAGFTLVEVMVAVMVISISISALLFQMMSTVDDTGYLRDKTIAQWVALNQLEQAYLKNSASNKIPDRESSGSETMGGRKWFWQMKPVKTQADGFIQLKVSVSLSEDDDSSLVTVTGLVDQFHDKAP